MSAAERRQDVQIDVVQERLEEARIQVADAVRANPYAAVAAGFGVGIVLGGGIPNWFLRLAVAGAARVAVAQAVRLATEPLARTEPEPDDA